MTIEESDSGILLYHDNEYCWRVFVYPTDEYLAIKNTKAFVESVAAYYNMTSQALIEKCFRRKAERKRVK